MGYFGVFWITLLLVPPNLYRGRSQRQGCWEIPVGKPTSLFGAPWVVRAALSQRRVSALLGPLFQRWVGTTASRSQLFPGRKCPLVSVRPSVLERVTETDKELSETGWTRTRRWSLTTRTWNQVAGGSVPSPQGAKGGGSRGRDGGKNGSWG